MMRIYVIRHGETEPNTRFACIGRTDVPLNSRGREQAARLCRRIGDVAADVIYVSPLSRAYETIEPYCRRHPDVPIVTEPGFIERDYGKWDNMTFSEIERADGAAYAAWQADFTGYRIPGGESSEDVHRRIRPALEAATKAGETVFIVTHLGTARQIISQLLGLTLEQSWRFTLNNAACAVIDYDGDTHRGVLKYLNV